MIEPRCPDCISPEIGPDPQSSMGRWRCENCGERFDLESAFIQLREAEDFRSQMEPEPLFRFDRVLAEFELLVSDGPLRALNPYSDAEELHRALDAAMTWRVIEARREGAALRAYQSSGANPRPVLGVDPGIGAELIGPELALRAEQGEDPVSYTLRWLEQMVESANELLAGQPHGVSGGPATVERGNDGPRSHREMSGRGSRRRYIARAYWLGPDAMEEPLAIEGFSVSNVLTEIAEGIEAADFGAVGDALNLTLISTEDPGGGEKEPAR